MVLAFAYLLERKERGQLDAEDVEAARKFLEWVVGLKEEQVTAEALRGERTSPPIFLSVQVKETIKHQIEKLGEETFQENPQWQRVLIAFFRGHVKALCDEKIFKASYQALEKEVRKETQRG